MAFGTRRAMGHLQETAAKQDIEALTAMNAERGTARAFSRTVRDVINFRGQTRHFLQRAHEVRVIPPIAVLWGERDPIIPIGHGRRFVERVNGAVFQTFPDCGHYLHQERPAEFVSAVRAFLDAPYAQAVTLHELPDASPAWSRALQKLRAVLARSVGRTRARPE
jgi:pimeloyl-ACP methyl ester carboxylesterase